MIVLLAQTRSISDSVSSAVERWRLILIAVVGMLVVFSVIQTYLRARSWVPTIGVILVGALAVWGVSNVPEVQTRVQMEVDQGTSQPPAGSRNSPAP